MMNFQKKKIEEIGLIENESGQIKINQLKLMNEQ